MLVPYFITLFFTVLISWNIHHHDVNQLQQKKHQIYVLKQRFSKRAPKLKVPKKTFYGIQIVNLKKDGIHG